MVRIPRTGSGLTGRLAALAALHFYLAYSRLRNAGNGTSKPAQRR